MKAYASSLETEKDAEKRDIARGINAYLGKLTKSEPVNLKTNRIKYNYNQRVSEVKDRIQELKSRFKTLGKI